MEQVLIPRYPGAKSSRAKYPVWDGQTYDTAIVPFAGSGRWCIPALQRGYAKSLIVADADPAVRAVWREFARPHADKLLSLTFEVFVNDLEQDPEEAFRKLCFIHDTGPNDWYGIHDYVAAKILLHKLCFGGNVRSNAQGKLNVSLRSDWADAIQGWRYELPWCPPSHHIEIYPDWAECFNTSTQGKTIAFIDPPYYAPGNSSRVKGGMSKAYSVHGGNPNDAAVLEMFKGAVQAAVDAGCDRIVATNYHGHWLQTIEYPSVAIRGKRLELLDNPDYEHIDITILDEPQPRIIDSEWVKYAETTEFMQSMGFEWFHDLGPLQSMNNINFNLAKAGTTEQRTIRHEGWWEMGGVRQHGRVVQKSLFGGLAA